LKITLLIAQTYPYPLTPIVVHLSDYLYELYRFYQLDPQIFNNSIQFITKLINF